MADGSDARPKKKERGSRRKVSARLRRELIEQLAEGRLTPIELARQNRIALEAIAQWAARPEQYETLAGLVRLADTRAQMIVSEYRANAAAKLIEIATRDDGGEVARKACVDLLRTNLNILPIEPADREEHRSGPRAPSEQAIRAALEELGRRDEASDHSPDGAET
ncbi:MAG: hypothetical protein EA377_07950 [Phycisphaerales bacterium]|nr:MAG: hypothetical protein EA377_07950 [Phycisphaerales bacterium]